MPTSNKTAKTRNRPASTGLVKAYAHPAKVYKLRQARGVSARIPAGPTREHILCLFQLGLNQASIARAAGVVENTVEHALLAQDHTLIDWRTAQAIQSVTWMPHPRQSYCLPIGARRRAQALARIGRSLRWQAKQLGRTHPNYTSSISRNDLIQYATWAEVLNLYEQWSDKPVDNWRAVEFAAAQGWPSPLAWEGVDIDHPHATPSLGTRERVVDRVVVDRLVSGKTVAYTRAELQAAFERLNDSGYSASEIANRLRMSQRTVAHYRNRLRASLSEAA